MIAQSHLLFLDIYCAEDRYLLNFMHNLFPHLNGAHRTSPALWHEASITASLAGMFVFVPCLVLLHP